MTGDCHVRICGSPGVRFPRATRPLPESEQIAAVFGVIDDHLTARV